MHTLDIPIPLNHPAVTERFVGACQEDERALVAFLGGSYAGGDADAHSDLDLFLITTDDAYEGLCAERMGLLRKLAEPLFGGLWPSGS